MFSIAIQIVKHQIVKKIVKHVGTICSNSFFPTVNTPARITPSSRTLIDNIYYNEVTKNITSSNITTSISDHLTQFFFVHNRHSDSTICKLKQIFINFLQKVFKTEPSCAKLIGKNIVNYKKPN